MGSRRTPSSAGDVDNGPARQVWLFKQFGAGDLLGPNLDIPIIGKLEATRRTLGREGGYTTLIDRLKQG